jgi:hypothetical protein
MSVQCTRAQRRALKTKNAKQPVSLRAVPKDEWPTTSMTTVLRVWRSRDFLVQEHIALPPATVRRHIERYPAAPDLVALVDQIGTPDSTLVCVHRADLWNVVSTTMSLPILFDLVAQRIQTLEDATGEHWYVH